jgi:acyl-CoA thioesterase FadM
MSEVDSLGHVNNAAYLDIGGQAVLDALEDAGWSLDRMLCSGSIPVLVAADVEYLGGAIYGDRLDVTTWFTPAPGALDAHQRIARAGDATVLVQSATRWCWAEPASGTAKDLPDPVLTALRPVLAA